MKLRFLSGLIIGALLCAGVTGGEDKIEELKDKTVSCGKAIVEVGGEIFNRAKEEAIAVFSEND